jgi:replicative DNA helicase
MFSQTDAKTIVHPGQITLIEGGQKSGKTTLTLDVSRQYADEGQYVLLSTIGLHDQDVMERIISLEAGLTIQQYHSSERTADENHRIEEAVSSLDTFPLFIIEGGPDMPIGKITDNAATIRYPRFSLITIDSVDKAKTDDITSDINRISSLAETTGAAILLSASTDSDCITKLESISDLVVHAEQLV